MAGKDWTTPIDYGAKTLTMEDIKKAIAAADRNYVESVRRETEAYLAFIDAIPDDYKDNDELRAMAHLVAWSQTSPMHPNDARRLRARYEHIINGGT